MLALDSSVAAKQAVKYMALGFRGQGPAAVKHGGVTSVEMAFAATRLGEVTT